MKKYIISVALLAVTFSVVSCRKNAATLPKGNSEKQEEVIIDEAVEMLNEEETVEPNTGEESYDNTTPQDENLESYEDTNAALENNEEELNVEEAQINSEDLK